MRSGDELCGGPSLLAAMLASAAISVAQTRNRGSTDRAETTADGVLPSPPAGFDRLITQISGDRDSLEREVSELHLAVFVRLYQ
jgi:hypothetical protein